MKAKNNYNFFTQLSFLIRAGISPNDALIVMSSEKKNSLKVPLARALSVVSRGGRLSEAVKEAKLSNQFIISIIEIGEISGTLALCLSYAKKVIEKERDIRRKVISALIYPVCVIICSIALTLGLILFIFPKILPILDSLHTKLPLSTRIVISIHGLISHHSIAIIFFGVAIYTAWFFVLRIFPRMNLFVNKIYLGLPLVGNILILYNTVNIFQTLTIPLSQSIPISDALILVTGATNNPLYKKILEQANRSVEKGELLSRTFEINTVFFPNMCAQLLKVGEIAGNVSGTFEHLLIEYELELDSRIQAFTRALEPVLMLAVGGMVGFIALSMITPIYGITNAITF